MRDCNGVSALKNITCVGELSITVLSFQTIDGKMFLVWISGTTCPVTDCINNYHICSVGKTCLTNLCSEQDKTYYVPDR